MFLAQISDTHLLSLAGNDPVARQRADNLERCITTINNMPTQPQAVIHTGDMINFAPANTKGANDYGLAREILSALKAPFYPTPGNRDSRSHLVQQFVAPEFVARNAPFCQYRVVLDDFDLVCVDTKSATRNIGASCPDRVAQIDELLRLDENKPVFIFMHHPPARIEALKNPLQFESIEQANALTQIFDKYDNIVRILCGHTHRSDVLNMGRHTASTHPSLATDVRLDHYPGRFSSEPVFQMHQLHGDQSVTSMSHFALQRLRKAA